jgi:hypothetical protein
MWLKRGEEDLYVARVLYDKWRDAGESVWTGRPKATLAPNTVELVTE